MPTPAPDTPDASAAPTASAVPEDLRSLLDELRAAGVHLWADDGRIRFRGPAGALTDEHRATLREHRDGVLALLDAEAAPSLTPDPDARHDPFPLTDVQGAYLVGRGPAYDYGGVACHAYAELEFDDLDPDRLRAAWNALVRRHDMLRSVVSPEGHQRVLPEAPGESLTVTEVGGGDTAAHAARARERLRDLVPDASSWPLVRLHLTRGDDRAHLHLSVDLLAADYTSVRLLLDELAALYADPGHPLPPLGATFRDYVLAHRSLREGARYHRDRAYWTERADDLPPAPELPLVEHSTDASARFTRLAAALPPEQWRALRSRAADRGLTPAGVALAAYAEVLALWSRRPDFTLNLPVSQRLPLHPDVDRVVGDFTSLTLLAVHADDGATFTERARTRQGRLIEDVDHCLYSGNELLAELSRRRDEPAVLMPVVFTGAIGAEEEDGGDSWAAREVHGLSQTPQVWVDCQVSLAGGALAVRWDVREGVLPDGLAADAFAAYTDLLRRLALSDEPWDEAAPAAVPAHQLLTRAEANDTEGPLPDALLYEDALAAALRDPDAPAVVHPDASLTHGQLWARITAVADELRARGCGPGDRAAVVMDKGVEQVVAAHAVLLTGAAYVPVDTTQPAARRRAILRDAGVRHVLTQSWLAEIGDWERDVEPVEVDAVPAADALPAAWTPDALPPRPVDPDALAYVIYTSGSTGTPKGVMVSHRAALNTIADVNRRFSVGSADRVLGLAALGFDLSVYDLFGPLGAGGAIVLPHADRRGDPSHWAELAREHGVTLWNSVPAQMGMLADYLSTAPAQAPTTLRAALLSGDWIPLTLADRVRAHLPGTALYSFGGATEGSIWSIHHPIGEADPSWPSVPYGRPLTNQTFHVLDERMGDRPDWVAGELHIGGAGVATGYLGDEARTAERFVTHPRTGERLYRTGDLGRYRPGGDIEFLGREDDQVKIRGHRVELAEIEAALTAHPAVASAAVLAVGGREDRRLAAFAETARRPSDAPAETGPGSAALAAASAVGEATANLDRDDLAAFLDAMRATALGAITRTLTGAGLFSDTGHTTEEVIERLGTDRRHHRLVRRWLRALADAGRLTRDGDRWSGLRHVDEEGQRAAWERLADLERRVDYGTEVLEYMRACSGRLPELLRGDLDVRTLLFPGAALDTAGAAYRDNLAVRHLNAAAAAALADAAASRTADGPLRVLEIGAGVGGTTEAVVTALAGHPAEYRFTDVSPFFVNEARERFADFPWVSFGLFDLNREAGAQGYAPNSFDAVVAANVLHNAVDADAALARVTELLAPGGHLVFLETTAEHDPALLVSMEFLDGLDGGHRDARAEHDQTFLTRDQWESALERAGATEPLALPEARDRLAETGQTLYLARVKTDRTPVTADELVRHTATRLPEYMVPAHWRLLDALPLTANGKVDRAALLRALPGDDAPGTADTATGEPADDLERALCGLWAELLERGAVGRDDDFFALGGDSLLVARMVGRLSEVLPDTGADIEWEVVLRHMLRRPTVAGLAAYLRDLSGQVRASAEGKPDPYVPLNGPGGGAVTALVHAGTGTLIPYRSLITEIRRRSRGQATLVGLELPDVPAFLDADPAAVIKRWAADYANALLERGGDRFHVVGYCLGGLVATEVARTLTDAGAEVASLTAISTHRPPFRLDDELISEYAFAVMMGIDPVSVGFPADENRVSAASDQLLAATPGLLPDGAIGRLTGEYADVAERFRELAKVPRQTRIERMCAAVPPSAGTYTPEALNEMFAIFRQSVFAISRYEPEPYAGDVTFLRHGGAYPFPGNKESVTTYWERLVLGELDIVDVPGDHFSLLSVPYAPGVLKRLEDITGGDVVR
ncbi:non-ribosomal peptide synthetase [Nocardiopsis dassonvillei]|uniref:non-ribosomal peptide synthetase n=1 Tax=Nocardiopsis dassonvillei TaxID=2014 RepID=UPI0022841B5D|nr:non-ribosomal peptide synthetase [Nocardiopsis dassonvillei]